MPMANRMRKLSLSSKIRMAVHPKKLVKFAEKHLGFCAKYAATVLQHAGMGKSAVC